MNYCEDAILDLIILTIKITDMVNFEKPGILQEIKNLYNCVLPCESDSADYKTLIEYNDYDVLSGDNDTGEIIGFRIM